MATRSFVAVKVHDGYEACYVHWDGYPEYMLRHLPDNPVLEKDAAHSIRNGEFEWFPNARKGAEKFYGNFSLARAARDSDCEYLYVFENGNWNYTIL